MSDCQYILLCYKNASISEHSYILSTGNESEYYSTMHLDQWSDAIKGILEEVYTNPKVVKFDTIGSAVIYLDHYDRNKKDKILYQFRIIELSLINNTVEILGDYYTVLREYIYSSIETVKKIKDENNQLKSEIEILKADMTEIKNMLMYGPGGPIEQECKEHFESLSQNYELKN